MQQGDCKSTNWQTGQPPRSLALAYLYRANLQRREPRVNRAAETQSRPHNYLTDSNGRDYLKDPMKLYQYILNVMYSISY
ncbi:hypothetical protein F2P81_022384 [Scophthalmus maximus]|uniref:Uncharacterized protein n=1 Tax=Scophthalmus maximus TaxID=52904 RepID=A0A6A4RU49_SCOMX|nr:hypothetical protein F2P81_022384 [Scophthalmus maximus]